MYGSCYFFPAETWSCPAYHLFIVQGGTGTTLILSTQGNLDVEAWSLIFSYLSGSWKSLIRELDPRSPLSRILAAICGVWGAHLMFCSTCCIHIYSGDTDTIELLVTQTKAVTCLGSSQRQHLISLYVGVESSQLYFLTRCLPGSLSYIHRMESAIGQFQLHQRALSSPQTYDA